MSTTEENQERYRNWYETHGTDRNERRRLQYAQDPSLRRANAERAKAWRQEKRGEAPSRTFYRFVGGRRVRVWSTGQIAAKAGVSPQSLRLWDSQGKLPPADFDEGHRFYLWPTAQKVIKAAKQQLRR